MENNKKNILVIGKGAVASAFAKKIAKEDEVGTVYVVPGNGVESEFYTNIDIREDDLTGLLKFALENGKFIFKAETDIEGQVNNQFSMDENEEYFRIATTSGNIMFLDQQKVLVI